MSIRTIITITAAGALVGCAATMPRELVDARKAYAHAATSPAAELSPAELHVAKQSLQTAERDFRNHGNTVLVRDEAYVASRKAEIAEVFAQLEQYRRRTAAAVQRGVYLEDQEAARTRAELARTRTALGEQQA